MVQKQEEDGIVGTFVKRLNAFALSGYAFDYEHELREGTQREAFDGYIKGLSEGHTHGYFEIPTGVGKTALFISLIRNYLAAANSAPDAKRVLIAVPSTDLVVQTAKAFAKFMPEIAPTIEADDDQGKQIDWEHSGVGVQYSGLKHAGKKPKVLITTYQSLCQDKNNKTYPPSEYGLVVYDEGHNITAQKFGTAVQKFKDSIQLAVSATPDYSEDKSVSNLLPHRYYHLPLDVAIARGDLCPVDPILIKTNYTVDEKKFKEYLEQQAGKLLTTKQYESLLNQESRNLAAIKTYLLGKDANTGDRYLGDTGMIFAGGVQHCNDFVLQMEKVVNSPDYRPVKDWLKAEGVALIAPIHNGMKSVELTIDGKKGTYTKDQVKELHRKGKVLLLVSDKKLKEGTDFPRDSIIMELVDRLSVVDATQRYGRGFRLDLPDPANNNPEGNPYKRCRVFNMVDENTYSMYQQQPQMLPIYCAEILGGATFREPMKRTHLIKRFKNDVPDVYEKLEDSGFEVITEFERVKAVSKKYQEYKKQFESESENKQHWLSPTQICLLGHTSRKSNRVSQVTDILKRMASDHNTTYTIEENQVEVVYKASDLVKYFSKGKVSTFYADPRLLNLIIKELEVFPQEHKHWLSPSTICRDTSIDHDNVSKIKAILATMLKDEKYLYHLPAGQNGEPAGQYAIGKLVARYRYGEDVSYYVDPRVTPIILERLGIRPIIPETRTHWITGTKLCGEMQLQYTPATREQMDLCIERMSKDKDRTYEIESHGTKLLLKPSDLIGEYRSVIGGENAWYVDPRIAQYVRLEMGLLPSLPKEKQHWLRGNKAVKALHLTLGKENSAAFNEVLEDINRENGLHLINGTQLRATDIMGKYSMQGLGNGTFSVDPSAIGTVITKDMVLAKKAEIAARGEADPSPQERNDAAPDADKGEAATTDDTRAGLKKAKPEPRTSPADMTPEEREAGKRGGNKRG